MRDVEPWDALLASGREDERLVATTAVHARTARAAPLPHDLHPSVAAALERRGVSELWSHQASAFAASETADIVVTTGTASGKSLAFNLPVLDQLCRDPLARALYLYPTKALAQDQARALAELGVEGVRPAIYDGDTPREARGAIRRSSNLILTNPDMLHMGILPNHEAWRGLPLAPDGGGGRRGARLPRRLRLARRQRAATPAPPARRRDALPDGDGDDRQPGRARRAPDRTPGVRAHRRRRLARRAPDGRDVEPAADRRGARHPPLGPRRGCRRRRRAGPRGRADDLLHEVAARRRADVALRARRARSRACRPRGALPRRLHAAAAARARAPARGRASSSR